MEFYVNVVYYLLKVYVVECGLISSLMFICC